MHGDRTGRGQGDADRRLGDRPVGERALERRELVLAGDQDVDDRGAAEDRRGQRQPRLGLAGGWISTSAGASSAPAPRRARARRGRARRCACRRPCRAPARRSAAPPATRLVIAPRIGSCSGTSCASAARFREQRLADQPQVRARRCARRPAARRSAARARPPRRGRPRDSASRNGPGVVPPGTASVARSFERVGAAQLVGDELGEVAHQRAAVGIGLARDLDHAAISRQRWPSPPVSL